MNITIKLEEFLPIIDKDGTMLKPEGFASKSKSITATHILEENRQDVLEYNDLDINTIYDENSIKDLTIPTARKELILNNGSLVYPRSKSIARYALYLANFKCEADANHDTFIRKNHDIPYTEPHHLIPLAYAEKYDVSIDHPYNIVSLCSTCHNKLHYGRDIENLLRRLYLLRKDVLSLIGIKITLEELLEMYY